MSGRWRSKALRMDGWPERAMELNWRAYVVHAGGGEGGDGG